ncbi:MAG: hypothetical protein ACT4P6_01160 [Gemmatimonadaceae bacterium]
MPEATRASDLTTQAMSLRRASDAVGTDNDAAVVRATLDAQRQRIVALRAEGTIGDAAFQRVRRAGWDGAWLGPSRPRVAAESR